MKYGVLYLLVFLSAPASADKNVAAPSQQKAAREEQHALEARCESIVLDSTQPEACRLEYAVRWLRTATLDAKAAPDGQRTESWQEVARIAGRVDRELSDAPDYFLIQIQSGLSYIEQAKQLAITAAAPSEHATRIAAMKKDLRRGLGLLRVASRAIETRSTKLATSRQKRDPDALTIDQLAAVGRNVALERARGFRWQAMCYPAESPDWQNSLGLAIGLLKPLTGKSENKDDVTQQAQRELRVCQDLYAQKQSGVRLADSESSENKSAKPIAPLTEPAANASPAPPRKSRADRLPARVASMSELRAIEDLKTLAEEHPSDGELQEAYARRLALAADRGRDAYVQWSRIEQRSKTASPRWRRARVARIELLEKLGEPEKAERLRKLTDFLYPDAPD